MSVWQHVLHLPPCSRGIHLITRPVEQALQQWKLPDEGLVNLFLQHTSAALTINENADPDVRRDINEWLNRIAPENQPWYRHTCEGPDDLPAHLKSSAMGVSLTIPLVNGQLGLGTWQGVYMLEFRNHAGSRRLVLTVSGAGQ